MDPKDQTQNPVPPAPDDAGLGSDTSTNLPGQQQQPTAGDAGTTTPPVSPADSGYGGAPAGQAPAPTVEPTAPAQENQGVGGVSGVSAPVDEPAGLPSQPAGNEVEREGDQETSPQQPPQPPQPPIAPGV